MASGDLDTARVPFWRRWLHAVASAFSDTVRAHTPLEIDLKEQVAQMSSELAGRDALVASLRGELKATQSELKIRTLEVEALAGVIERDRMRVEAETAIAARRSAEATVAKDRAKAAQ